MAQVVEVLIDILGDIPYGYDFIYITLAGLLLIFVFHILEHVFEIFFSRFFKS